MPKKTNERKAVKTWGLREQVDAIELFLVDESYITRDKRTNKPILILKNKDYRRISVGILRLLREQGVK